MFHKDASGMNPIMPALPRLLSPFSDLQLAAQKSVRQSEMAETLVASDHTSIQQRVAHARKTQGLVQAMEQKGGGWIDALNAGV
jgi:hypothetical protein